MKIFFRFLTIFLFQFPTILFADLSEPALIQVQIQSTVGILIDDFPTSIQNRIQQEYLRKPEPHWKARALRQVETTLYRLIYRNFYYNDRGRLPLPPKELWKVKVSRPKVLTIDGHQLVGVDYLWESTLLTTANSVKAAEPALANIGGIWNESFVLPADPDHLLQRTGMSCMDEAGFPPGSVDSENARNFFDDTCLGGANICHTVNPAPADSCVTALEKNVGRVPTQVQFRRIPWNSQLADKVRVGRASANGADLEVVSRGLENNRIIYRYIQPGSCAIAEKCVGGPGWRRLLQFDASVANRSKFPIHLGDVSPQSTLVQQNMFSFSACHGHFHFDHYGTFSFGDGSQKLSSKRAFCLESTSRYSNNEFTPLSHPYTCHYQGIAAGWGDDYIAGIECQWIDITDVKGPVSKSLAFRSNPDLFLCEGQPFLDSLGNFQFESTNFKTESGATQNRIRCDFNPNWQSNNFASRRVVVAAQGSFVTAPCLHDEDSTVRNCGFSELGGVQECAPGKTVQLTCQTGPRSNPALLRICEASAVLNSGVACTSQDALRNFTLDSNHIRVQFRCPSRRDSLERGGKYSLYQAPAHVGDRIENIICYRTTE